MQFAAIFPPIRRKAFAGKAIAARFCNMRALKSSRGKENSEREKRIQKGALFVGVVLNLTAICFNSLKQIA